MKRYGNLLMLVAVILLVALPLVVIKKREGAEIFLGADDRARDAVSEVAPGYKPWAHSLMEPPSSEVGSMLFALQAAIGAGFIGYYFGSRRSRPESNPKG